MDGKRVGSWPELRLGLGYPAKRSWSSRSPMITLTRTDSLNRLLSKRRGTETFFSHTAHRSVGNRCELAQLPWAPLLSRGTSQWRPRQQRTDTRDSSPTFFVSCLPHPCTGSRAGPDLRCPPPTFCSVQTHTREKYVHSLTHTGLACDTTVWRYTHPAS